MATSEQNRNDNQSEQHKAKLLEMYGKYRGMRAFLLTRVSSGSQGHEAQERVIRELLIKLIGFQLDEERHIIHDTYTGLEYRYREALDEILRMAAGCSTKAFSVDEVAWKVALDLIHNPSQVDQALKKQKSKDPTERNRKQINKNIAELENEREALQSDLKRMIRERKIDRNTEGALTTRLREIDHQVHQYESERANEEKIQQEWAAVQQELERLHKKCAVMREKLKRSEYVPDYKDERDMIEFFRITAILWENGHIDHVTNELERIRIQARFNDIVIQYSSREVEQ